MALAAAAAVAIAGCAQIAGTPTSTDAGQQTGASQPDSDSDATESATDPTDDAPESDAPAPIDGPLVSITDPIYPSEDDLDAMFEQGADPLMVALAAGSATTLEVIDGHTFTIHTDYAFDAEGDRTVHLFADPAQIPSGLPSLTLTDDGFTYTEAYTIDAASMPADLLAQVADGIPDGPPPLGPGLRSGPFVTAQLRDGSPTVFGALMTWGFKQAQTLGGDALVAKAVELKSTYADKIDTKWKTFKGAMKLADFAKSSAEVLLALQQLAALEKCARNPTNPISKKTYEQHPEELDKIIKVIEEARTEVVVHGAVLSIDSAGQHTLSKHPVSTVVNTLTGPARSWGRSTIKNLIKKAVDRARKAVPKCTQRYAASGGGNIAMSGTINDLAFPFTLHGQFQGGSASFSYTPSSEAGGAVSYAGGGGGASVNGSGSYTVSEPDEKGGRTLTQSTNGCATSPGKCKDWVDVITLTPID